MIKIMEDDRFTRITLRIPKDLHEQLTAQAEKKSRSMNAEIITRLEKSISDSPEANELARQIADMVSEMLIKRNDK